MGSELDWLNAAKYLYLRELTEPRDNSLRLVVDEAIANRSGARFAAPHLPELENLLQNSWPIESTMSCKRFELSWKQVAAYLVTEECVGSGGSYDDETYSGNLLRVYKKSHFLEHLARDTSAHPGTVLHYKLICLNHLIDVASYAAPEIRLLSPRSGPVQVQ